jgi:hypothetical protein
MPAEQPRTEPINGPLLEWLMAARQARPARRRPRRVQPRQEGSRSLFLLELEINGQAPAAARAAGCTLDEVRAWRADPMFDRDYVLALAAHVRAVERLVQEVAKHHPAPAIRDAAGRLLARRIRYLGADGRLDARAWRDVLSAFAASLGVSVDDWDEPESAVEQPAA